MVLILSVALLMANHILESKIGHDAVVIDICIGIGYLMYLFL